MSSFLRASPLIVIACFALAASALAAPPKPDFAITTKSIEANVVLDAKIKADPPLAADCLAEGKKWAQKQRAEADAARKEMPDAFRQGGWSVERKYEQRSVVGNRYISIVRDDLMMTGGAHPNLDLDTILWDRTAGKRISIRPFFKETADGGPTLKFLTSSIIDAVKVAKKARHNGDDSDTDWIEAVQPSLLKLGPVTLAHSTEAGKSSGLTFHFAATALGVHAEGGYVAFVPWQQLKSYLTPDGVAIFGGARPAGDDDGLQ